MRVYRLVSLSPSGDQCVQDSTNPEELFKNYKLVAVEEDSYTMRLHGEPIFKGLIGPMSDGKNIIRYETPDVFAAQTERWSKTIKNGQSREE